MRFGKLLVASAAMACAGLVGQAQANVYVITTIGHVWEGIDPDGVFGNPTTDLSGAAYKAVYTITDPTPGAYFYDTGSQYYLEGGNFNGTPSPVSASITINGVTKSISGNFASSVYKRLNDDLLGNNFIAIYSEQEKFIPRGWENIWIEDYLSSTLSYAWPALGSYVSYNVSDIGSHQGLVSFLSYDSVSNSYPNSGYGLNRPGIAGGSNS